MDGQLREMVSYLVKQQFAREGDNITDRMKSQNLHITGSGRVIEGFIDLLAEDLAEIVAGNYENYLESICINCSLDMHEIFQGFLDRVALLEPEDKSPLLLLTSLLSEFLGKIRDEAFEGALGEIKNRVMQKRRITDINLQKFELKFEEVVGDLFQRNEPNISLLYNLCFLIFLADLLKSPKVVRTTKILQGRFMNRVVDKISKLSRN
jgi:hypothetical protein